MPRDHEDLRQKDTEHLARCYRALGDRLHGIV